MTTRETLRITVDGIEDHIDLGPDDLAVSRGSLPEVRSLQPTAMERASGQRHYQVTIDGWVFDVAVESQARALLRERAGRGGRRQGESGARTIKAQIPGRVVRVWVSEGDTVEAGQRLLAIEAMKMENEVRSPRSGTVEALKVTVDGSVELGDELLTVR
jgi:biotin carboxyl carrier protein